MTIIFWIFLLIMALVISSKYGTTNLPLPYRSRNCEGRSWRAAFPMASKQEIRAFLLLFASAFAFKNNEKLKFGPNDKIFGIYRALYPSHWTPDALELETLANDLRNAHGLELRSIWSEELTLGELFPLVWSPAA